MRWVASALRHPYSTCPMENDSQRHHYYAMYSSAGGRITTNPDEMVVPIDDHMVHRGDGVFETLKYLEGGIYNLEAHLSRLLNSAEQIRLSSPWSLAELSNILCHTARASCTENGLIRVLLSRGPGSMGVSPHDCPEPGLYVMAYRLPPPFMTLHPAGGSAMRSRYPVKAGFLAQVKSCNYLLNALMKMEAVDGGTDFVFAFDEEHRLAEGPTESVGLVSDQGELLVPHPDRILPGTTMERILELAPQSIESGILAGVQRCHLSEADLAHAAEVLIFGTTVNVTAVTRYEGALIGAGKPGPVQAHLDKLLQDDILHNSTKRTLVKG